MTLDEFLNMQPYKITAEQFSVIEKFYDGTKLTDEEFRIVYAIMRFKWEHLTTTLGPILTPGRYGETISLGWRPDYDPTWFIWVDEGFKLSDFAHQTVEWWREVGTK